MFTDFYFFFSHGNFWSKTMGLMNNCGVLGSFTLWTWPLGHVQQPPRPWVAFLHSHTPFLWFCSQNINQECKKETKVMRISGDICTGTFAWGGCRGSSAPGSHPALKASWERNRKELQQMKAKRPFQSRFATRVFTDKTGFAVQSWPVLPFLSADPIVITRKEPWLPCPALSKDLIAVSWYREGSCY